MLAYLNTAVRRDGDYRGLFDEDEYRKVGDFYQAHPELAATPLHSLPGLARHLSLGGILIKDETGRFGLEAFKIAGARYAVESLGSATLARGIVCATAGNHGRAVARAARDLGVRCTVFLPALPARATVLEQQTRSARIAGMRSDRSETIDVSGSYEDAVARAADHARQSGATVVSDTSWPGYEAIPRLIMAGYTRLFDEASAQWTSVPDVVLIQGGVGGLVCAAANWFAARFGARRPFLIACEPESAACLLESSRAGRMVSLSDEPMSRAPSPEPRAPSEPTMMAGLRCAEPSPAAWPSIQFGIDAFIAIPDSVVMEAIERLRQPAGDDCPIAAGPSGACGVGAVLALVAEPEMHEIRTACGLGRSIRVMAIVTEGP